MIATMLLMMLSQQPVEAEPKSIAIYFEKDSCNIDMDNRTQFITLLEIESKSYELPVVVTIVEDKADYRVQWGRTKTRTDNIDIFADIFGGRRRTNQAVCLNELIIADGRTGKVLYTKDRMAALQKNRIKDFFEALKSIVGTK